MNLIDSELNNCYKRAIFHLGRRALSSFKLKEKLLPHFSEKTIDQCLLILKEKKYLDDQDYFLKKIQSGKLKGRSTYTVMKKLAEEGFDIRSLKNDGIAPTDEDHETLINYIVTKKRNLLNDKEKLYRHLAYKGHRYSTIEKIWQKLTSEIND